MFAEGDSTYFRGMNFYVNEPSRTTADRDRGSVHFCPRISLYRCRVHRYVRGNSVSCTHTIEQSNLLKITKTTNTRHSTAHHRSQHASLDRYRAYRCWSDKKKLSDQSNNWNNKITNTVARGTAHLRLRRASPDRYRSCRCRFCR